MKKSTAKNKVVIFHAKNGAIELRGDVAHETIWATQAQIAAVFSIERSVVTKHIRNIFKDGEVKEKSNVQKMHIANSDKPIATYSLDVILGVGYRTNSKVAIDFRKWATKTLHSYIVDGFAVNKNRIAKNYSHFLNVVDDIKQLLPAGTEVNSKDAVELVSLFADTWLSLDAYDRGVVQKGNLTRKKVELQTGKLASDLFELKKQLTKTSQATDIFGVERSSGSVAGIVGNVMQSFGGKDVYPSVEEKAANLLYFMVKNHPFTDGNKRSGAFAFVWFLKQQHILDVKRLNPSALTALTILVASSDPKEKDKVVSLVLNLIAKDS